MKRSFICALLVLSFSAQLSFGQTAKPKLDPPKPALTTQTWQTDVPIVTKTLANGLEVIVMPDSGVPLVTVELDVRNGSFTEPPELNGLSHLYEHMFFKGNQAKYLNNCENFSSIAGCGDTSTLRKKIGDVSYLNNINGMGITWNGETHEEVVDYYFTSTSQYLETAIRYVNDAVRYPTFDEREFAEEKEVVIGELDRNVSNPYSDLIDTFNQKLFYKYPTRKMPGGTRETVAMATTDQMRLINSRYYVPNNSALVVTGDVKPEEVFAIAEKTLGSWERRAVDPFKEFPLVEHPPLPKSEGVVLDKRSSGESASDDTSIIAQLGWQGPSIGKDNAATYAADVFSFILTQPDSKFQRDLVDTGLVSGISISYYTQQNVGPITITLQTQPDKAKAALKAVYAEIAQFSSPDYFSNEELSNAKTLLAADDLYSREKASTYAHTLGFWWSTTGIEYFRGYQKNLNAITRADISKYVNTYIIGKPHVGVAIVPPSVKKQANLTTDDMIGSAANGMAAGAANR